MPKFTADKFNTLMLRQQNMKVELKDMKAHEEIISDGTFKKTIKEEEKKKKLKNIEDIFDKGKPKKDKKTKR